MQYDIIIIGSGLGGLECGYILAKKGYKVCVLEQNTQIGGCLQSFRRGNMLFDTGFHCVGGLDEGQSLHWLFKYFDLLDLPWHRMDSGFAEVVLNEKSYILASGHERFVDTLSAEFPQDRKEIENYTALLKNVGTSIFDNFSKDAPSLSEKAENGTFGLAAYRFMENSIGNKRLINVLSGASLKMELSKETLPLYIFAQINNSFIQSAWRLAGCGSMIADKLAANIRKMGGTIFTKTKVTRMVEKGGKIVAVETEGNNRFEAQWFISDVHPSATLDLIDESACIRKIYRKRITALPNTFGMFTVHLKLKNDAIHYFNRNIFVYDGDDVWASHQYNAGATSQRQAVMISCRVPEQGEFTDNIDILSPMHFQEIARWKDSATGRRGEDYEIFKQRCAAECIALAKRAIPNLQQSIDRIYTSSPLTYRDYTGTCEGSAYGIRKDCNRLMHTMLTPRTPIANLLLTGQNLNLHGILGVSMTSLLTLREF
ncbi:MAG: FAD-dependent oxidoreductase [Prevotellaceae bacterium]|jgi:all-trans-retinol 13,14-reductase|nr:FAD-dependent oxidoreductase [Prevotellaceae bacterium]